MLIPLGAFVLTTTVCLGLALLFVRGGRNRDHQVLTGSGPRPLMFGPLTEPLAGVIPCDAKQREKLTGFLRHAGHYHRSALAEFRAMRNALVIGWFLLITTTIVATTQPGDRSMIWLLVLGGIGSVVLFALPRLLLETMAKQRQERIDHSLPDALDMITMCMSGGLPLQMAMQRVSQEIRETHADLAFELRVIGRQMEAGSLEGAIKQFAARIDTQDSQSLAAMIGQTEQHGSSVALAFQDFADNVRLARRQRADEQGNKTALKLLFPLVFCLAPPVYMMLLMPAAIEMSRFIKQETQPGGALSANPQNVAEALEGNDIFGANENVNDLMEQIGSGPQAQRARRSQRNQERGRPAQNLQ